MPEVTMRRVRSYASGAIALAAGLLARGCECAEREPYDATESTGSTSLETTAAEAMTTMGVESTSRPTEATDGTDDISRFVGGFHNEVNLIAFGFESEILADPRILNIEILADGTASMTMETCDEAFGTLEIGWLWELRVGPTLEFTPGHGEESLRYALWTDLESLRVTLIEDCDLLIEVNDSMLHYTRYRPGKACWVNRCETPDRYHIDYCEGEEPLPCE
jgi:hypothetical protein